MHHLQLPPSTRNRKAPTRLGALCYTVFRVPLQDENMTQRKHDLTLSIVIGVALYGAGAGSSALAFPRIGVVLRLAGLLMLAIAAGRKRSLTGWIFLGMLAGIELGLDAPQAAISIRVLSDIFLRLIKVIVAPLIFGTLVTGIAGHGHARSLGRLGLKSLLYFEVLTTIALLIGLAAINISRAGVGLDLTQTSSAHVSHQLVVSNSELPSEPALTWQQFLLRIFPENIAKAVADNQIL